MLIPETVKKCVVFIGIEIAPGEIKFCGTGFFVSRPSSRIPNHSTIYLVTARHVVAGIGGRDFYVRINTKDGKSITFKGDKNATWWFHPDESEPADIAVYFMLFPKAILQDIDFAAMPITSLLTDTIIKAEQIGDGDEVFITGLFSHHSGSEKNLPIIRTGNIAMMPDEPVLAKNFGNMECYLIECKSISGISGSPVFVIKPTAILIDGHMVPTSRWRVFCWD